MKLLILIGGLLYANKTAAKKHHRPSSIMRGAVVYSFKALLPLPVRPPPVLSVWGWAPRGRPDFHKYSDPRWRGRRRSSPSAVVPRCVSISGLAKEMAESSQARPIFRLVNTQKTGCSQTSGPLPKICEHPVF